TGDIDPDRLSGTARAAVGNVKSVEIPRDFGPAEHKQGQRHGRGVCRGGARDLVAAAGAVVIARVERAPGAVGDVQIVEGEVPDGATIHHRVDAAVDRCSSAGDRSAIDGEIEAGDVGVV